MCIRDRFRGDRVGMFKMGLGMWLYDILSLFQAPELHERLGSIATMKRVPSLKKLGLKGSYVYSDAYMDDDRLVIETLRSAHRQGACTANYVLAKKANFTDGQVTSVNCVDVISGEKDGEEFEVKARHIVSTVGPWTDELGHRFFDEWQDQMRPSKGVHLSLIHI